VQINWHTLVETTVFNGHYGLENLALIPGNAGAAPIQNIGAYGKEVCDNLVSVDVLHKKTMEATSLTNSDCEFGYRHSLFKTQKGSELIVLGITLQLSTLDNPVITYRTLKDAMHKETAADEQNARSVFNHVCKLRQSKLPDPSTTGNAGSFFKNPVVPSQHVDTGDVGVHDRQALVLVNHGNGTGQQIATLADEIRMDIKKIFNIELEREPVFY